MPTSIDDYFAALDRIKSGNARNLPKGTRITNDAVAIEAGRKKGAIRKSRPIFAELILAIRAAAEEQAAPDRKQVEQLAKAKRQADHFRALYEDAIAREICLLREVSELKKAVRPVKRIKKL